MECGTDWDEIDGRIGHASGPVSTKVSGTRGRGRERGWSRRVGTWERSGCGVVERVGLVWRGCPRQGLLPRGEASTDHPLTTPHSILPALSPSLASPRNKESSPSPLHLLYSGQSCSRQFHLPWHSLHSFLRLAPRKATGTSSIPKPALPGIETKDTT